MSSQTDIEKLVYTLNLSPYQAKVIFQNRDIYDMSRIEKRGDVLFVPRRTSGGILSRIINGRSGDVIGRDRMFLSGARCVRFCAGGYYAGRVGQSVCYGDGYGRAILRTTFESATKNGYGF